MMIIRAQWKPAKRNTSIMQFGPKDGELQVLVDAYPEFYYEQFGVYFYAEVEGLVNVYEYCPGTTAGFGGRQITLRMKHGGTRTFNGALWSPFLITSDNIPSICSVSVTDDPAVMERGHTFVAYFMRKELYDELRAKSTPRGFWK